MNLMFFCTFLRKSLNTCFLFADIMKKIKDTDIELLTRLSADYDDWYSSEENKAVLVKGSNEDLERFITLIDDLKKLDEDYVISQLEDINIEAEIIRIKFDELDNMVGIDIVNGEPRLRFATSDIGGFDFEYKINVIQKQIDDLTKRTTEILNYFKERKENDCA